MADKNKDKDIEWKLYTKAYEIASRTGQIKTGTYTDPERSGILDSYYHLISTEGKLLARFPLDQLRALKQIGNGNGCGSGCAWFMLGGGVTLATLLAAIILPGFMDIKPKAKASAAAATLATMVKECAAKIVDQGQGLITVPEVDGYISRKKNVAGFYIGNERKVHGATILCPTNGEIKLLSEDESELPTFSYNLDTGKKACFVDPGSGAEYLCRNGEW